MMLSKSIRKQCFVLFLLLMLPLTSCSSGIKDPIGDSEIGKTELWAPLMSPEEVDALFGSPSTSDAYQFYGDYVYFYGPISAKSSQNTIYRYNIETGIAEYVCQEPACSHTAGSSCPFARVTGGTLICALGDGIAYRCEPGQGVEWYNIKTKEHKFLTKEAHNCFRVGDTVYYDYAGTGLDPDDPRKVVHQLWRVDDLKTGDKTLVGEGNETVAFFYPYELDGKETIVEYSMIDPEGKPTPGPVQTYLYTTDPETGEKSLFCDQCTLGIDTAGTHFLYYALDYTGWTVDGSEMPSAFLCLTDATTGETTVLEDKDECDGDYVTPTAITDRCAMWLKEDRKRQGHVLHCYVMSARKRRNILWRADGQTAVWFAIAEDFSFTRRPLCRSREISLTVHPS